MKRMTTTDVEIWKIPSPMWKNVEDKQVEHKPWQLDIFHICRLHYLLLTSESYRCCQLRITKNSNLFKFCYAIVAIWQHCLIQDKHLNKCEKPTSESNHDYMMWPQFLTPQLYVLVAFKSMERWLFHSLFIICHNKGCRTQDYRLREHIREKIKDQFLSITFNWKIKIQEICQNSNN